MPAKARKAISLPSERAGSRCSDTAAQTAFGGVPVRSDSPIWGDADAVRVVPQDRRHDLRSAQVQLHLSGLASLLSTGPVPTLREVAGRYDDEHVTVYLKPASEYQARLALRRVVEWYGDTPITEVGQRHALDCYRRLTRTMAAKTAAMLATLCRFAGVTTDIDAKLCKPVCKPRTRVLLGDDAVALLGALGELDEAGRCRSATDAIRFLLATGLRVSEACGLAWEHVAPDCSTVHLADSKTGPRPVILGTSARAFLAALYGRRSGHWVFPGRDGHVRVRTVQLVMRDACRLAGLPAATCHALRHSAATRAVQLGIHSRVIMALFGWSSEAQLRRYIHVQDAELRAAANVVSLVVKEGAI